MAKLPRFAEALPVARPSSKMDNRDTDFILDPRFFNSLLEMRSRTPSFLR